MVKLRKPFLVAACFVLVSCFFALNVSADDWNKATIITTNQPIEVPGRVLPAGRYLFKLMDSLQDRHIVQIMSDDQSKLYQTVLGIPEYRAEATDNAAITFYESPRGSAIPVRSWFYAGERSGIEFIYPKERGKLLATVIDNVPPSQETVAESAVTKEQPGPAILEKPEPAAVVQAPAAEPESEIALNTEPEAPAVNAPEAQAPAPEEPKPAQATDSLPRTASPDDLFLLVGLGSAFAAWGIRRLRS